jgi:hypothetical protein
MTRQEAGMNSRLLRICVHDKLQMVNNPILNALDNRPNEEQDANSFKIAPKLILW